MSPSQFPEEAPTECDYCDEKAVVLIKYWKDGVIDLGNLRKLYEIAACVKHFTAATYVVEETISA